MHGNVGSTGRAYNARILRCLGVYKCGLSKVSFLQKKKKEKNRGIWSTFILGVYGPPSF